MILALSGGIGGAKLALGLSYVLPPEQLTILANTGDDFEHLGLAISPDIDTLMYTLAGLDNPETGWGRRDESWAFMEAVEALGGATWFRLGDRDLATHVERTRRLRAGETLSAITAEFCHRLGARPRILPMSDDPVRTRVLTIQGWVDFQDWFVGQQARPAIRAVQFQGTKEARPQPEAMALLASGTVRAVVICPSNPLISIEPILAVPGLRQAIRECGAPVIAVSPIIGGQAVKGPTAKMLAELGEPVSAAGVARRYGELLTGYVMEPEDDATGITARVFRAPTLMRGLPEKIALAKAVLAAAEACRA
ncbi:2-phospho-L-lactate transferase [Siccirubricoccus sp. KC 17139]|uniref:2-phospho-L-lactate transferase n=1 Tax=Siccirubricoccus soli TaxID=2899147 RepID=A0ABT1D3T5_9PROT|nr:2-phospho-L-lactate transferase [Siccirubricoccus soli]MCO6416581.1 2-phospho-L-lactate transferase [Siccirubricoccus soli]MCP2682716.1 2-phospho-L-lactate transferase [Siccirubricoccus soli]